MDFYTTVSVLSVAGGYVIWLWAVAYLRILQYRENEATTFRRETSNPLKLAHIPDPGGYEFDFNNPRNRYNELQPKTQRAFNTVLNQAENYAFFAAAVLFNVVIRGIRGGTREVALMSFVHLCSRFVSGFSYVIGFNTARTAAFIVGIISNSALFVLLLDFASFEQEGF